MIDHISKTAALQPSTDQEVSEIVKWQFIVGTYKTTMYNSCKDNT